MNSSDQAYFSQRGETERAPAQDAEHRDAVNAHYVLAGDYHDRVYGDCATPIARGDGRGERLMANDDLMYLLRRAAQERQRADYSTNSAAKASHIGMAEAYERRVRGDSAVPAMSTVGK